MRKPIAIIGIIILGLGSISYNFSSNAFEEVIGQSQTNIIPDEWESTQQKRTELANYFGALMFSSMIISLAGLPVLVYGLVQKFSSVMALVMGVLLFAGFAAFLVVKGNT